MDEQERAAKHTMRIARICKKVIAISELKFAATGNHRHDYQIAISKLRQICLLTPGDDVL